MLVHKLSEAPDKSLILLDEPETSLHPRAQRELMRYVARQCVIKKYQVILSTHAPSIIEELPEQAIKILDIRKDDSRVDILSQSTSPAEAFNRLGATHSRRTILVEDDLAAELVRSAARAIGSDYLQSISILPVPGGSGGIKTQVIPVDALTDTERFVILDGDMRPPSSDADDNEFPLRKSSAVSDGELEDELSKLSIKKNRLLRNGGNDNAEERGKEAMRRTLIWINSHVRFLPSRDNPDYLLLKICEEPLPISSDSDSAKAAWKQIANETFGLSDGESVSSQQIFATQQQRLAAAVKKNANIPEILEIQRTLRTLLPPL
jgi:ABC-type lipoprotein export system ATPase subunit